MVALAKICLRIGLFALGFQELGLWCYYVTTAS